MRTRPEVRTPLSRLVRTLRVAAWTACVSAGLVAMAVPALAERPRNDERGPQWNQRMEQWERMPPERRERILREQQRYQQLSPQEQRRLRDQYRQQQR